MLNPSIKVIEETIANGEEKEIDIELNEVRSLILKADGGISIEFDQEGWYPWETSDPPLKLNDMSLQALSILNTCGSSVKVNGILIGL